MWTVDFSVRPTRLRLTRDPGKAGRPVHYRPFALPDSLYRQATRRVVGELVAENRRLRMDRNRPPTRLAVALVWALERAMRGRAGV